MARQNPRPDGPLQTALQESTIAATTRAAEGQKIFSPIATFLDKHRSQNTGLTPHQLRALAALSNDLADIAQRHFNAYISGIPLTFAPSPAPAPLPPSPPPSRPPSGLAQSTYATITQTPLAKKAAATQQTSNKLKTPTSAIKQQPPDYRLFVRLPDDHGARNMDAYAIYTSLRSQLGIDNKLLKGVQPTKTGFALCPTSPEALPALEAQKETISAFFNNCLIERSSRWVSYRVTNVPRKIGQISQGLYSLVPIDPGILSSEVAEATGLTPISISETATSAANTSTVSSSWFINFPENTKPNLPTQFRLFGITTNAQPLSRKTKAIQCNWCWKWHNPRSCARHPRCRLCGSTQHIEEGHTNHCAAQAPHNCPPRCLHCHGPHPADHEQCLLRPSRTGTTCTKAQRAEIRKTGSLNLAKARLESNCCTQTPVTPQDQTMAIDSESTILPAAQSMASPFRPTTPPPRVPADSPPVTAHAVRFASPKPQNRFNALMNEEL